MVSDKIGYIKGLNASATILEDEVKKLKALENAELEKLEGLDGSDEFFTDEEEVATT